MAVVQGPSGIDALCQDVTVPSMTARQWTHYIHSIVVVSSSRIGIGIKGVDAFSHVMLSALSTVLTVGFHIFEQGGPVEALQDFASSLGLSHMSSHGVGQFHYGCSALSRKHQLFNYHVFIPARWCPSSVNQPPLHIQYNPEASRELRSLTSLRTGSKDSSTFCHLCSSSRVH